MLDIGSPMFVILPDERKEPVFHPGRVLEANAESFKAAFDQMAPPAVGTRLCAYGEVDGKFYQQETIVQRIGQAKSHIIIAFQIAGAPVSAEKRASYRIRTSRVSIFGRIGDETRCRVTDVSPEGLAVITAKALEIGSFVKINVVYDSEVLEGHARVQCISTLSSGKYRCGFLAPEDNSRMRRSLERISSKVQRVHLRTSARFEPEPRWWNE